jgi:DDE family transposase
MDSAQRVVLDIYSTEIGGGTVLQQAEDGGAVDRGGQARGEDDPAELPSVRSNDVRLWLSVMAYNLGNLCWRRLVLARRIDNWSLTGLQQRLVETGRWLVKHARYYWLLLAESHLTPRLFAGMVRWIAALPMPAG